MLIVPQVAIIKVDRLRRELPLEKAISRAALEYIRETPVTLWKYRELREALGKRFEELPLRVEHRWYKCTCNRFGCQFCDGGLSTCVVCGGAEGTLPTDCPGEKMSAKTEEDIYAGKLDYRASRGWVTPDGTGKSMGDWKR